MGDVTKELAQRTIDKAVVAGADEAMARLRRRFDIPSQMSVVAYIQSLRDRVCECELELERALDGDRAVAGAGGDQATAGEDGEGEWLRGQATRAREED